MGLQCWIHSPDDWVNSRKFGGGGLLTVPLNKVLYKKITVGKLLVNKHLIIILYNNHMHINILNSWNSRNKRHRKHRASHTKKSANITMSV